MGRAAFVLKMQPGAAMTDFGADSPTPGPLLGSSFKEPNRTCQGQWDS